MCIFPRRQQWYHLFGCEIYANRAITARSWDYFVYLRDLALHKDHLPHHRMTSQSALLLWRHLLTAGNIIKYLHDISGPCVSLLILAPELGRTAPLNCVNLLKNMQQTLGYTQVCLMNSVMAHLTSEIYFYFGFIGAFDFVFDFSIVIHIQCIRRYAWLHESNLERRVVHKLD